MISIHNDCEALHSLGGIPPCIIQILLVCPLYRGQNSVRVHLTWLNGTIRNLGSGFKSNLLSSCLWSPRGALPPDTWFIPVQKEWVTSLAPPHPEFQKMLNRFRLPVFPAFGKGTPAVSLKLGSSSPLASPLQYFKPQTPSHMLLSSPRKYSNLITYKQFASVLPHLPAY